MFYYEVTRLSSSVSTCLLAAYPLVREARFLGSGAFYIAAWPLCGVPAHPHRIIGERGGFFDLMRGRHVCVVLLKPAARPDQTNATSVAVLVLDLLTATTLKRDQIVVVKASALRRHDNGLISRSLGSRGVQSRNWTRGERPLSLPYKSPAQEFL